MPQNPSSVNQVFLDNTNGNKSWSIVSVQTAQLYWYHIVAPIKNRIVIPLVHINLARMLPFGSAVVTTVAS